MEKINIDLANLQEFLQRCDSRYASVKNTSGKLRFTGAVTGEYNPSEDTTINIPILSGDGTVIEGVKGDEGLGILRSSAETAVSTASIALSTITVPEGRAVKIGDLILANSTESYLYQVTTVDATSATVVYITSLRGASSLDNTTALFDAVYPVGSIYMSINSTSPASLFGGTWAQISDKYLVGVGTELFTQAEQEGGAAMTTLTEANLPAHTHDLKCRSIKKDVVDGDCFMAMIDATNWLGEFTRKDRAFGGDNLLGESFTNLPPSLAVYMWKRTA